MSCYKRILNEFNKKIPEKLVELDLDGRFRFVQLDTDIVPSEIGVINNKTDVLELKIIMPSDYPFKAPAVFVPTRYDNSFIGYNKWCESIISNLGRGRLCGGGGKMFVYGGSWGSGSDGVSDSDLECAWVFSVIRRPLLLGYWNNSIPTTGTCLCCKSIVCSDKWSPSITLCDILAEYVSRRDFQTYTGKLMRRWIGGIFNNDRWVIPDELVLEIIKGRSPFKTPQK